MFVYRVLELLKGELLSVRVDMYLFGICLWQMFLWEYFYGFESYFVVIFGVVVYYLCLLLENLLVSVLSELFILVYIELMRLLWDVSLFFRFSVEEVLVIVDEIENM